MIVGKVNADLRRYGVFVREGKGLGVMEHNSSHNYHNPVPHKVVSRNLDWLRLLRQFWQKRLALKALHGRKEKRERKKNIAQGRAAHQGIYQQRSINPR